VLEKKRKIFLLDVLQKDKLLFVVFILFVIGQVFFTYKGVETFPFLHYGMYSAPVAKPDTLEVTELKVDSRRVAISSLPDAQKSFVESSFNWYNEMLQNNNNDTTEKVVRQRFKGRLSEAKYSAVLSTITNDSAAIIKYPKWLFQYIADMRLVQNANMEARTMKVQYKKDFSLDTISSTQVFYYASE
jgi:hypothetical protein